MCTLLVAVIKKWKATQVLFVSQFKGSVQDGREGMATVYEAAGHIESTVQNPTDACWYSVIFPSYSVMKSSPWTGVIHIPS